MSQIIQTSLIQFSIHRRGAELAESLFFAFRPLTGKQKGSLSFALLASAVSYYNFRMILAGLPAAMTLSGISLVTTLPAPIMEPAPMVSPQRTVALDPKVGWSQSLNSE